jgi:hypothetical protein
MEETKVLLVTWGITKDNEGIESYIPRLQIQFGNYLSLEWPSASQQHNRLTIVSTSVAPSRDTHKTLYIFPRKGSRCLTQDKFAFD